jgi:hypothetical protein
MKTAIFAALAGLSSASSYAYQNTEIAPESKYSDSAELNAYNDADTTNLAYRSSYSSYSYRSYGYSSYGGYGSYYNNGRSSSTTETVIILILLCCCCAGETVYKKKRQEQERQEHEANLIAAQPNYVPYNPETYSQPAGTYEAA